MNENTIKRYTIEEIRKAKGQTDWDRLATAPDPGPDPDDIEVDWATARIVTPEPKQALSIRLDKDLIDFFKDQGKGYQTRINAVLRAYMEAQKGLRR
ncbi:BrnA antitoxin family protein [Stagnihabitans tardus]|uniref:BrnA antitoxin family protein n=1 Tax=Stagnihabitans tardus TaxID=2699202 RepID=A0AAE4Y7V7_9RHOB|nr:BrnA antitoxin family protein [Stagnihabitans tardus]NBZ86807.1 hypothetical protein [Stagnihabitans tardus]